MIQKDDRVCVEFEGHHQFGWVLEEPYIHYPSPYDRPLTERALAKVRLDDGTKATFMVSRDPMKEVL